MNSDLANFLARYTPLAEESAVWWGGVLFLRITCYLGIEQPPLDYVTSVRSLVFQDDAILLLRNRDGIHILPGGRREADEPLEEALLREILEETGWKVTEVSTLGFMHFHHLNPKPAGYAYPYPDFVHAVYMAEAAEFVPEAKAIGDYEVESAFRPIVEVQTLDLSLSQRLFLDAALNIRK